MLYPLNTYNFICQLYLSKAEEERKNVYFLCTKKERQPQVHLFPNSNVNEWMQNPVAHIISLS